MKNIIGTKEEQFLEEYLNTYAPTSYESSGQKVWLEYLKPYIDDYIIDNYGTAAAIINPGKKFKVAIEAHADEISWMVKYIDEKGMIYVLKNGGSDHSIAPSMRVVIHGDKGQVRGVFGWPAVHVRRGKNDVTADINTIFIDCGCITREEVEELGIHVGTVITFDDPYEKLNDRYYMGRALDNRIGGFMIAQVARLIKEQGIELPYTLYIVNSVQEEVGLRGAQMIASNIQPDVAIVTDVSHDTTTPHIKTNQLGELACGKGPILAYGPAVQNNLLKLLIEAAEENEIPFQREANSRGTGTDADAFAFSGPGIVTALLSLPLRYMHTTVEMVDIEDVSNLIQLYIETLKKIENNHNFKYIQ